MSERIEVGDLVQVVRPALCCGASKSVGKVFVVDNIYSGPTGVCLGCGNTDQVVLGRRAGNRNGWDIRRLKRIPPLAELEERKEAIEA